MPYKSDQQRKMFHVLESEGKIAPETVREWDKASKGKALPIRVKKTLNPAKKSHFSKKKAEKKKKGLPPNE